MFSNANNHVFVIMGVSGSGKSIVASELSRLLNAVVLDGDFLHPRANIDKMSNGIPLNDNDRTPWIAAINDAIYAMQRTHPISLVVCSSLKKIYRDQIRTGNKNLTFLWLHAEYNVIESRMKVRRGHFFKPQMLQTQFDTLEAPEPSENDVLPIDVNRTINNVIEQTATHIRNITGKSEA